MLLSQKLSMSIYSATLFYFLSISNNQQQKRIQESVCIAPKACVWDSYIVSFSQALTPSIPCL